MRAQPRKNKPICVPNAGGGAGDLPDGVTVFIHQKSQESGEKTVTLAAAETVFLDVAWLLVAKIMFSSAVGGSCQQRQGRGSGEDQGKGGGEKNLLPEAVLTFSLLGQIISPPP